MNIGIIGAGAWGTALAISIARAGTDVVLWSFDGGYKQFDNVTIPTNITITPDIADIAHCDAWLVVTPAAFMRDTLKVAQQHYNNQPVIICTKGAEASTGQLMSDVLTTCIPQCSDFGVLSGPQFAAEVAMGIPTGSTLAGGEKTCKIGKEILKNLHIQESNDIIGAEICGVGKNAVALICGYNSIACSGENERALIFTRAWNEVINIGIACGAQLRTFSDLCGIGDLFLSATSVTSRNYSGGVAIANKTAPNGTVEGIFALHGLIERANKHHINAPTLCEMQDKINNIK